MWWYSGKFKGGKGGDNAVKFGVHKKTGDGSRGEE